MTDINLSERFMQALTDDYPYRVEGPDSVPGEAGDEFGSCISRPIPEGRRTWAFEILKARDAFVATVLSKQRG